MKKSYKNFRNDIPLYFTTFVFVVILFLWFFPNKLGLISSDYSISQFRSDLKDLASIFYIVITLWLVLVTRKMAEVSLNSQKSFNRPELMCELFISNEKPINKHFSAIRNIEIRNAQDSEYVENQPGANVFLIVKNRYGGGKSINLKINANFEATNPDRIALHRRLEVDYLAEGDSVAFYFYRFEKPSTENCSINLNECRLEFTTPFNEASKDSPIEIVYNKQNQILATGNHIGAIKLESGIRIND
jgi:hypothetical protein